MCKYFTAGDEFAVEGTHDVGPSHPGMPKLHGLFKALVTVYEPEDDPHPSLPTLREFLEQQTEPKTGLLSYDRMGPRLTIDPAPLRELPPEYLDYRVSPGSQFVPFEVLGIPG